MDKAWKQMLAVLVLGMLLPQAAFRAGAWLSQKPVEQTEPSQTWETAPTGETAGFSVPVYIPVVTGKTDIAVMELETYVTGVVLAEMPTDFDLEALKAQAVVARTYALRRICQGDRHPDGAVCTDSSCCQAYISVERYLNGLGYPADVDRVRQAVLATAGLLLTYGGEAVEATYFSCSGGKTEDALEVWGENYPYLQSVESPGEETAVTYRVQLQFTPAEFAGALDRKLTGEPAAWLGKVTYTQGGGVKTMDIDGQTYTGSQLRQLLGLNSSSFRIKADGGMLTVEVSGKGHRVGMSQYGAEAMAAAGRDYREILGHYYPGTEIDKISTIG